VDKLTSKKYAKTINLLCAGNKVFVKCQAQEVFLTPTPLAYALAHCAINVVYVVCWAFFMNCENQELI